jgi:hypothetical protein
MSPAEIKASNEEAEAMNAYNARVTAAVDSLLAHAARAAVGLVLGCIVVAEVLRIVTEALA